jgi:hypothetical protein
MKILILLLLSIPTFSQTYLGLGLQNKGANISVGTVVDKVDLQLNYKYPLSSAEESKIISITIGWNLMITKFDEDNYLLTPFVGGAFQKYDDFTLYDINPIYGSVSITKFRGIYGLELGKNIYKGRISIMSKYCDKMYYGIIMRAFFD